MFLLIYFAIGLLGLYMILSLRPKKGLLGRLLPGPSGLPLIGSIWELTPNNLYFKLSAHAQNYGDIYRLKIFRDDMVVLNSAELIRKAFCVDPYKRVLNDRASTFYGDKMLFNSTSNAFYPRGDDPIHSGLRKGFTKAFHIFGDGRKEFERTIQVELGRLVEEIESHNGRSFEFQRFCRRFIENVLSVLFRGYPIRNEEEFKAFNDYASEADWLLNPGTDAMMRGLPFLSYLPTTFREHYHTCKNAKAFITEKLIEEAKATYKDGEIRGYLDFMIRESLQSRQEGTPEDEMVYTDITIITSTLESIAAGQITSLSHLSAVFLLLINHPQYQERIQEEIDRVIGRERLPCLEDKVLCPFIEAVVLEAHRHIPAVPGLLPHVCRSDTEFEGYHISKGSIIISNIFHVHHDDKIWDDPWTFRPERFLDDNGQLLPYDHPLRKSWLPFGTGRRLCVGENMARSRGYLFIATLLQRWSFRLPPGDQLSSDPRDGDIVFNVVTGPKIFNCIAVPRLAAKEMDSI